MAKGTHPVPSRKNIAGIRVVTIAVSYESSSKQNSDDFFADFVGACEKAAKNRTRQITNDTKVTAVKSGRITWDEK